MFSEVVLEVFRKLELHRSFDDFGLGGIALRDKTTTVGHDVDELVLLLERLCVFLDFAQLFGQIGHAVIDEVGGVAGYLVLVVDFFLAVLVDERPDDGVVFLDDWPLNANGNEVRGFVGAVYKGFYPYARVSSRVFCHVFGGDNVNR